MAVFEDFLGLESPLSGEKISFEIFRALPSVILCHRHTRHFCEVRSFKGRIECEHGTI